MTNEDAPVQTHRPSRATVEVGLVLSIVGMLVGLAFNAGIQYAHLSNLENRTGTLETEYNVLHDKEANDSGATAVQLAHISTLLDQIQAQQQQIQTAIRNKH